MMRRTLLWAASFMLVAAAQVPTDGRPAHLGSHVEDGYSTRYIRLGTRDDEALLFEPKGVEPSGIALIYAHPNGNSFGEAIGAEMARHGHPILMVNYRGAPTGDAAPAPGLSRGIKWLRSQLGVRRVIIIGHSGGGHLVAFYQNVARNGPAACQGADKLQPCDPAGLVDLAPADGVVLLDPTLGAFHQMSAVDPAMAGKRRLRELDMFSSRNGYADGIGISRYSPAFVARFHAAQSKRNATIVADALKRRRIIDGGRGRFSDDEPFVVEGMGVNAAGARLYQPDTSLLAHTKRAYPLLRADGSTQVDVIRSVRPASPRIPAGALRAFETMAQNTTVRRFLANSAIRTSADFAITEDDIRGVDWRSAITSTPANAQGIDVPTLVMVMSCHYLVVPGEIIFDNLATSDKTLVGVEGATHLFAPCRPEFGDTAARTFDSVDRWLRRPSRF